MQAVVTRPLLLDFLTASSKSRGLVLTRMTASPRDACRHELSTLRAATPNCGILEEIEEEDDNMLIKLQRPRLREELLNTLEEHTSDIRGIVSDHLSLSQIQQCRISDRSQWLYGDFNACIPITVTNWREQRLLLRCPFPYMVGDVSGLDEKVRCEAATFAWISINCPQVPTPRLWGFGLPDGLSVRYSNSIRAIAYLYLVQAYQMFTMVSTNP